jgi:hypothetical protein
MGRGEGASLVEGGLRMVRAAALGTLGVAIALLWAPAAVAEPEMPVDPSAPLAVVEPVPAGDPLAVPPAEAVSPTAPADGVPHLPAPDALPPGTTQQQTRNSSTRGYLKDVWEAVRSGDVTTGEALLLIAQRPMDSKNVKQEMTPPQSTTPGAVPAPAAVALPPAPSAVPVAEAVPAAEAAPPAEATPPAEAPLLDPAPPLPFTLAP